MPRDRFPSDEARLKVRPHVKVHLTVASHRRTAAVWADLEMRAMLVELWRIAGEAFAGKTGDTVALSPAALRSVTGRERHFTGLSRLRTLCSRMGYEVREDGRAVLVTIRNFARKQGFDSARRGVTPPTTAPSDSDSYSDSEFRIKKKNKSGPLGPRVGDDPCEGFDPARMVRLLGSRPDPPGTTKLAWLTEHMPHLVAAARAQLSAKGVVAPSRSQLGDVVKERMFAFYEQRMKSRSNGGGRDWGAFIAQVKAEEGIQ